VFLIQIISDVPCSALCIGPQISSDSPSLQVSFAEYSLFYRALFAKETYNLIDPQIISDCPMLAIIFLMIAFI